MSKQSVTGVCVIALEGDDVIITEVAVPHTAQNAIRGLMAALTELDAVGIPQDQVSWVAKQFLTALQAHADKSPDELVECTDLADPDDFEL